MPDFGAHAPFIWAAYGLAFIVIAAMIAWIAIDGRTQARIIAELETKGVRRRSDPTPEEQTR